MKPISAILIGAGQRGAQVYGAYALAHPAEIKIIAVAEPNEERRMQAQKDYNLDDANVFEDWQALLQRDKFADCALICTQDNEHFAPAKQAILKGYHLLMEKPMSSNAQELQALENMASQYNKIISVCHVLRYTPFFSKVKEIIESGYIGEVMSLQQIENVGYWHQAHSFVRGNWRRSDLTSPMILAKSCHDMDIILWLMNQPCTKVSSFGALTHFTKENAPTGAPKYCLDGCPNETDCPYSAQRIYMQDEGAHVPVIRQVVSAENTDESVLNALKKGPYGRCVYACDNDVVDHQVVNLEFANTATASFTMCGFTLEGSRTIKIMGTKGQIKGDVEENLIEAVQFTNKHKQITKLQVDIKGHSGGDVAFMKDFVKQIQSDGAYQGKTSAKTSVESHLVALAAEKSRVENKTIIMKDFVQTL